MYKFTRRKLSEELKILFITFACIGTLALRKKFSSTRASSIIDYRYQRILSARNIKEKFSPKELNT